MESTRATHLSNEYIRLFSLTPRTMVDESFPGSSSVVDLRQWPPGILDPFRYVEDSIMGSAEVVELAGTDS